MAWRACRTLRTVAGSVNSRCIVQDESPFGKDSESKWQVKRHEKAPEPLGFRGLAHFVTPVCIQWLAMPWNAVIGCAAQGVISGDFSYLTWGYSHSMASVLPSRHSSYTQFSTSTRNACRRMTRCRVSSASGTKAGTTSKTFFKLRALSFCFCPKVRGGSPLEARWRRKRPF